MGPVLAHLAFVDLPDGDIGQGGAVVQPGNSKMWIEWAVVEDLQRC